MQVHSDYSSRTNAQEFYPFDITDVVNRLLGLASEQLDKGEPIGHILKVCNWNGQEVLTAFGRPVTNDGDYDLLIFETFSILNALDDCFATWTTEAGTTDDGAPVIHVTHIDTSRHLMSQEVVAYSGEGERNGWDPKNFDIENKDLSTLGPFLKPLAIFTGAPPCYEFPVLAEFLERQGWTLDYAEGIDPDHIHRQLRFFNVQHLREMALGGSKKVTPKPNDIEVIIPED